MCVVFSWQYSMSATCKSATARHWRHYSNDYIYVYVTTWSTVDYTSVKSSSVSSSEENRCREDAINMFTVRPTVIEFVMLVATVVHCTLIIKHRENLICSLVVLIYLTIRMRIILKSESAVYRQSPRYVYEGSFFIWHNRPILLMRQTEAYGFIELIRLLGPQERGYPSL